MSDDGGLYNPDNYGCRKRVFQILALAAAVVVASIAFLCM